MPRMSRDPSENPIRLRNYYRCGACGVSWYGDCAARCNGRCMFCGAEHEPYESEDLPGNSEDLADIRRLADQA